MPRALSSDELGEKGESRFRELCVDAGLICNPSTRDRTGWDFIVEAPFPKFQDQPDLDNRPKPISCHVQVKTVSENKNSIRLRLSSAEHLAKEPKPAIIYVLKLGKNSQFSEAYAIHILDNVLSKILERLRKERADGNSAFNNKYITISLTGSGTLLPVTGSAFRSHLDSICDSDMQAYFIKKEDQRKTLGFDGPCFQVNAVIRAQDIHEMVDGFLGLKPELEIVSSEAYETRFGITMLTAKTGKEEIATLRIEPGPAGECSVKLSGADNLPPVILRGQFYVPGLPDLPVDAFKLRIVTPNISFVITRGGFSFEMNLPVEPLSLEKWYQLNASFVILGEKNGKLRVELGAQSPIEFNLANFTFGSFSQDQLEIARWRRDTIERATYLFRIAGVSSDTPFQLNEIEANSAVIGAGAYIFQKREMPNFLRFNADQSLPDVKTQIRIMVHAAIPTSIGTVAFAAIAHCVPAVNQSSGEWVSQDLEPLEIEFFQNGNYQGWIERLHDKCAPDATFNISNADKANPVSSNENCVPTELSA